MKITKQEIKEYREKYPILCSDEKGNQLPDSDIELLIRIERRPMIASKIMGQKGGFSTSPQKQAASRENGKKGGRPKKY